MSTPLADLQAEALKLSPEERLQLAEHLLASVPPDRGVWEAWIAEAERRMAEEDAGVPGVPLEEALAKARRAIS